jgi:hypothetical protein
MNTVLEQTAYLDLLLALEHVLFVHPRLLLFLLASFLCRFEHRQKGRRSQQFSKIDLAEEESIQMLRQGSKGVAYFSSLKVEVLFLMLE